MDIDYNRPKTSIEQLSRNASIFLLALMFILTLHSFFLMPGTVPVHFNISGEPDSWGSRWMIWLLPFIAVAASLLLALVHKVPQYINYPVQITKENAQRQFLLVRQFLYVLNLKIVLIFAIIQLQQVRMALAKSALFAMPLLLPIILLLVFSPIAVYFYLSHRLK
jgi:hypothetical protein